MALLDKIVSDGFRLAIAIQWPAFDREQTERCQKRAVDRRDGSHLPHLKPVIKFLHINARPVPEIFFPGHIVLCRVF